MTDKPQTTTTARNLQSDDDRSVFLIGPMGAGKSTVGKRLAKSLGFQFIDSDHELEARTGASISLIFDVEGEEGFRKREATLLDELSAQNRMVLATGGGAILRPENRRILIERGFVVYLYAPVSKLIERTSRDATRPLLQTDNPAEKFKQILSERQALYEQTADLQIDTDSRSIPQIISQIKSKISWQS